MTKLEKSYILSDVVEKVRTNSGIGGFVKKNEDGRWYEVGDFLAREKTSQAFRDVLHDKYKSSNTSKKKRRQEEQAEKLFRGNSSRSLDAGSVHTAGSSTVGGPQDPSKLMRVDRPDMVGFTVEEASTDDLLGALDMQLASFFGGRKGLASQRSHRSVLEFDNNRQAMLRQTKSSPSWYNHSCPDLAHARQQRGTKPLSPTSAGMLSNTQVVMEHAAMDMEPVPMPMQQQSQMQQQNQMQQLSQMQQQSQMQQLSQMQPQISAMGTISGGYSNGRSLPNQHTGIDPYNLHSKPPTHTQLRSEWLHHSQPNLYANINNPAVASRRKQFARMPPRRQASAHQVMSSTVQSSSAHNPMSSSSGHSQRSAISQRSTHSQRSANSMTGFQEQLDNMALSDRPTQPQVPRRIPEREEPEDIDINDLVLSPMAGETRDTLLASLASLSDSFAIEPIDEMFDPVPLRH
jgi:hypothetical protein